MKDKKILILVLSFCLILFGCGKKEDTEENNNTQGGDTPTIVEDVNDFTYNGEIGYGTATVVGYVSVEKASSSDVVGPGEDENKYDLFYFNITDSKNEQFLNYLKDHNGNAYVSENKFAIGCLDDNDNIVYYNDSDENGMTKYEVTTPSSTKIVNSTKDNPVKLEIEIFKFTGGSGAPKCYSFISSIKVKD